MRKFTLILSLVIPLLCSNVYAQSAPKTATVANVTLTSSGTEYTWAPPNGVGSFTIRSRTAASFQIMTASGGSYITIPSGSAYYETNVSSVNNTLYLKSSNAGQVIEIMYWI